MSENIFEKKYSQFVNQSMTRKILYTYVVVILYAFLLQTVVVMNGLHEDLLTVLTEAVRINNSQITYLDYSSHNGPIVGFIGAWFVKLFSVGYGYIFLSSIGNIFVTIMSTMVVFKLTNSIKLSLTAGMLIATWYFPQVGGWYYDHVSYLFILMASILFIYHEKNNKVFFIIGLLMGLAFWSKPTVGFVSSLSFLFSYVLVYGFKVYKVSRIFYGGIVAVFIGLLLIYIFSDIQLFINSFILNSLDYSYTSINKSPIYLIESFFMPFHRNLFNIIEGRHYGALLFYLTMVVLVYVTYLILFINRSSFSKNKKLYFFMIFLVTSSIASSAIVGRLYSTVTFGIPIIIPLLVYITWGVRLSAVKNIFVSLFFILFFLTGSAYIYKNINDAEYIEMKNPEKSSYYPIRLNQTNLPFADLSNLIKVYEELRYKSGNIAMYDDNTRIVAAMLGKGSWNTGLTQMYEITIPINESSRREWQENEIKHLELNNVRWIISTLKSSKRRFRVEHNIPPGFSGFKILSNYIDNKFDLYNKFGKVEVYKRNSN
jgi:hypothetical protein